MTADSNATERPLAQNYEAIWLEPVCAINERQWCSDDAGPCEDCGLPWIKYVRVDLCDSNQAEIKRLQERVRELKEALRPFANGADEIPRNWPDNRGLLIDKNHPENPKSHCLLLAFVSDFRRARTTLQGDKP